MLLRLAQGAWPPPNALESQVKAFKQTLQQERLRPGTIRQYLDQARLFLVHLERQQLPLENVAPQDLDGFIAERLRIYRRQYGHLPRRLVRWRCEYTKAINRLLRQAQGEWPPLSPGDSDLQRFEENLAERGLDRGRRGTGPQSPQGIPGSPGRRSGWP